jgi:hypothetical protein
VNSDKPNDPNEPAEVPMPDAWPAAEWTADGHVTEPTVHAWLDGALAGAEADAVLAHVASCAACGVLAAEVRGVIAGAARIVALLDGAGGATLQPERVDTGGSSAGRGGGTRTPPRAWYRRPAVLSMAAMLLLAVGVRTVWQGGAGDPRLRAVEATVAAPVEATPGGTDEEALSPRSDDVMGAAGAASVPSSGAPPVSPPVSPSAARAKRLAVPSAVVEEEFSGRGIAGGVARAASAPAPAPAPLPPAPPPPPALSAGAMAAMAADRRAAAPEAMERAAPGEAPRCLLVEAPASAGLQLPMRMQLEPPAAGGEGAWRLVWLREDPRDGEPVVVLLRAVRPDSLASTDTGGQGIAVTLVREGDGWRGTATAPADGAPFARTFRLRPTTLAACAAR